MQEIWKLIKGYEGIYEASNKGRVRNAQGHIMKPHDNGYGFMTIDLYGGTTTGPNRNLRYGGKRFKLHRLIGEMFVENSEGFRYLKFLDMNKYNCSADNLYWSKTTRSEY